MKEDEWRMKGIRGIRKAPANRCGPRAEFVFSVFQFQFFNSSLSLLNLLLHNCYLLVAPQTAFFIPADCKSCLFGFWPARTTSISSFFYSKAIHFINNNSCYSSSVSFSASPVFGLLGSLALKKAIRAFQWNALFCARSSFLTVTSLPYRLRDHRIFPCSQVFFPNQFQSYHSCHNVTNCEVEGK